MPSRIDGSTDVEELGQLTGLSVDEVRSGRQPHNHFYGNMPQ